MKSFDEFRPEQIEEQIEQLAQTTAEESSSAQVVQALQSFYARDASMLEQVWQRLEGHQADQKAAQAWSPEEKRREKITSMRYTSLNAPQEHTSDASQQKRKKRPGVGLFSTLAAVLACILLVGSLLFVFGVLKQQHQAKTANSGYATPLPTPHSRSNAAGLYVVDGSTLYRLDSVTGKMLWFYSLPGSPNAKIGPIFLDYAFATGNGVVYVGENDSNPYYRNNNLYAFDATTGQKLWTLPLNVQTLQFANDTLYAVLDDNIMAAINPDTGKTIWKSAQAEYVSKIVAIDSGIIYDFSASSGGVSSQLVALRASNGAQIWTKVLTGLQIMPASVTLANGVLYVVGSSAQPGTLLKSAPNYVQAYNASNGQQLWQSQSLSGLVGAAPAVAGGQLYIGTGQGNLYALNADNGQINWQLQPGSDVSVPAYVVNNTLYVAPITSVTNNSVTSQIEAYDATTGTLQWSQPAPNLAASNIGGELMGVGSGRFIVTASTIYYLDFRAGVQLLNTATGNPIPGSPAQLRHGYGQPFIILTH